MVDVTVQNAWLIYHLKYCEMSELDFRAWIAKTDLKHAEPRKSLGRPKVLASNVLPDGRFDKMGHYIKSFGRQVWKCTKEVCKFRPSQGCVKGGVRFCIKCFLPYHEK